MHAYIIAGEGGGFVWRLKLNALIKLYSMC